MDEAPLAPTEQEIPMAASAEDRLMDWLRDAHAAEEQAATMLASTARRIVNYPELKERLEQHVGETRRHEALVRGCIERRGKDVSPLKDVSAKMVAVVGGAALHACSYHFILVALTVAYVFGAVVPWAVVLSP